MHRDILFLLEIALAIPLMILLERALAKALPRVIARPELWFGAAVGVPVVAECAGLVPPGGIYPYAIMEGVGACFLGSLLRHSLPEDPTDLWQWDVMALMFLALAGGLGLVPPLGSGMEAAGRLLLLVGLGWAPLKWWLVRRAWRRGPPSAGGGDGSREPEIESSAAGGRRAGPRKESPEWPS
jgi:hypothetical protein